MTLRICTIYGIHMGITPPRNVASSLTNIQERRETIKKSTKRKKKKIKVIGDSKSQKEQ